VYHGGVICPGLQTGMRALAQNAARLHEAELSWPTAAVGRTTDEALRIGILRGAVGMVEHLLRDILSERNMRDPVILATGGLAPWMKGRAASIRRFEPDLTLVGINALFDSPAPRSVPPSSAAKSRKPLPPAPAKKQPDTVQAGAHPPPKKNVSPSSRRSPAPARSGRKPS